MKKLVTPFRVGLLVLASAIFLFVFLAFIRKGGLAEDESIQVFAMFRDASGLGPKSRVQIAGIPVGEVTGIRLEGTLARVDLRIQRRVDLRTDATLTKRSESLLGDYLLDLDPGHPPAPPMPDGGEIRVVQDAPGTEQLLKSAQAIAEDVEQVTESLRQVLGGDAGVQSLQSIVNNIEALTRNANDTVVASQERLDRILTNVDRITSELRDLTAGRDAQLQRILANVEDITRDTRDVVASVRQAMEGQDAGTLGESVASVKETLERIDSTVANVEEITRKVKEGEGAIGALVSNEGLGQRVKESVAGVADIIDTFTDTQIEVGIRTDYLFEQGGAKNYFFGRIAPKPDRYYLLELVDDPRGDVETTIIQTNPPSVGNPATQVQSITTNNLKVTAEFAKRFYFTTLRFGVIESTGGIGVDFHLLDDALTLRNDVFNFSVRQLRYPRLRSTLQLRVFDHLVATAGVDDILNTPTRDLLTNQLISGRDVFIGAGIYFTDNDLKAILPFIPIP